MSDTINWSNGTQKLSELRPWGKNPREITPEQAEHLQTSIDTFNFAHSFLISENNDLYDGHQRLAIMLDMPEYGPEYVADVRISSRLLTEKERRELVIRLHENTGEWDWDGLANVYEVADLTDWGMPEWKIENAFVPNFQPVGIGEQSRLDQKKPVECPECGHEFQA